MKSTASNAINAIVKRDDKDKATPAPRRDEFGGPLDRPFGGDGGGLVSNLFGRALGKALEGAVGAIGKQVCLCA